MPRKNKDGSRDYSYDTKYESSPAQRHNRVERTLARRELQKEGVVRKGDGMDVDHKRALSKGGSNSRSNLRAITAHQNRSKKNK